MALTRPKSTEFNLSRSFDDCDVWAKKVADAAQEEAAQQAQLQREESERKIRAKLSACVYTTDKIVVQKSPVTQIDFDRLTECVTQAKQLYSQLSSNTKLDVLSMLALYDSVNKVYIKVRQSGSIKIDAQWVLRNVCKVIDIEFIHQIQNMYIGDEELITGLAFYWFNANRVTMLVCQALRELGKLDLILDQLYLMNDLLLFFPDKYFGAQSNPRLCWSYQQDMSSLELDQFLLDALGFATDYEGTLAGRSSMMMLFYIIVKIFSPDPGKGEFDLIPQLNNAVANLRVVGDDHPPQQKAVLVLFEKALRKAFAISKSKEFSTHLTLNKHVCRTMERLKAFADIRDPYFSFVEVPSQVPVPEIVKNARKQFALHAPAPEVAGAKKQGIKRVSRKQDDDSDFVPEVPETRKYVRSKG